MKPDSSTFQSPNLASSPSKFITVVDVYDLAESINRDFEKIAEKFGKDSIESIVKKVICALETLEALAKNNDYDNAEIIDLQKTVEHLQHEKLQRIRDKENLEKDVADLEENYRKEIDELCHMVTNLQTENKGLKKKVALSESAEENQSRSLTPEQGLVTVREDEFQMMVDLRNISLKQKEKIKDLQKDIQNYCFEIENLQNNVEKLIRQNKELLRKNASLQKQGRLLVQERADLMRRLQRAEENSFQLRQSLNETNRVCRDMEAERQYERECEDSPRFTLEELRDVLHEKTVLKARVLELEEQLEMYKGSSSNAFESTQNLDQEAENLSVSSSGYVNRCKKVNVSTKSLVSFNTCSTNAEIANQKTDAKVSNPSSSEECLVYGPIEREPDEKLNPLKYERKHSGVRKFFRFFKELNSTGGLNPRRNSGQVNSVSSSLSTFTLSVVSAQKNDNA